MERLKKIIADYGRWSVLSIYIDRIEAHKSSDFSHAIENAKDLLETIAREICTLKNTPISPTASLNNILKNAFFAIGYPRSDMVSQISSALATIGQQIGDLRNSIGATSHGKSLEELRERNNRVDDLTRAFLVDSTVIVASFLIKTFENENPSFTPEAGEPELQYLENEAFNDFWDDLYGEFEMGAYSFPASEILFNVDLKAYATELKDYSEGDEWKE
ncbi:MAG: abortive infection family protein [Proteobacteria bacterium]|nr:abortive infection family protein [Pseudomonadota bacterium]